MGHPLKVATRVRIPLGLLGKGAGQASFSAQRSWWRLAVPGAQPVHILILTVPWAVCGVTSGSARTGERASTFCGSTPATILVAACGSRCTTGAHFDFDGPLGCVRGYIWERQNQNVHRLC